MQYFTPQLYQQFNSLDEVEAERANEAWDQAILAYRQQLDSVRDRMPSQIVALSELCLHDAEVIKREEIAQASGPIGFLPDFPIPIPFTVWSAVAVITLRLDGEILTLFYCLSDHIGMSEAPKNWRFSKLREHWLYDEVQVHGERGFPIYTHSILLSTGIVLDIPFISVVIHRFPIPQTAALPEMKTA
jgi:hypothetical protein